MFATDSHLCPNSMIARQHIQIGALVDALNSRFDAEKEASRNLVSLINSLAAHLEMHFELEEENEYFGYVLKQAPHLSERVHQLLGQHEMLKNEVGELVEMARQAFAEDRDATMLALRFRKFRKHLLDHERSEIELMQEAYTQDLGGGD